MTNIGNGRPLTSTFRYRLLKMVGGAGCDGDDFSQTGDGSSILLIRLCKL